VRVEPRLVVVVSQHPAPATGPRLLGPADVRQLADRLGLRPTKQRGQNFVIDPNTVRRIVRTADLDPDDVVLEVGPGLGSLTLGLLAAVRHVVAVEVDPRLAAALPRTIADRAPGHAARLEVIAGDAMLLAEVPVPAPTAVVANLPYNVAVPVLLHLYELLPAAARGLVMVQSEVAARLAAKPGSRVYGIPSVKAAWYADVRQVGQVARTVFWPTPNVDSGLVAWNRRPSPPSRVGRHHTFAVIDAAFSQRRKMLRSALAGLAGSPGAAENALAVAAVDPSQRGEQLDVAAFARIADALETVA
jgi:16S rRNA (adenine1518-N6/adenine1519-N6)-dimethyltransferase